uniref:NADH dehydrogenase subunit 6 n=1 Tax=Leptographium wingfieldii TaxID=155675 RepID=UPI0023F3FAB6|nr:NADH dehydrogenase subunit 6 [Leptographium wingfieldii]YP_010727806.1 NADH dehydrogenase subunit 6 [Leptographium terebrantis]YP_010899366.1 NADH dehydrogenase subunit 6 [Leptographium aureum]WDZ67396.1 NADH dehydrogenase subunit 6 [Leptographium wingfieldii]WDZ67443.1 NADH dehydrogenase subunit 6 [Leptographium wingfieldii]WDZ67490.1 NADH dehydrogenase subunit 6 [Leptographium wingfieldii]WDZ67537.1 NADH dehydrogenase subunit 6 [Leptographium wingfieldii]WDZ67583.1 NADH dehydrogenase su
MNNLFIISENFTNGYKSEVLDIISVLVILSGIFVIISKNPVISLLFLIGLFGGIASYLLIIGLSFLGISYLVVYIGAVSILFIFILMLINIRMSELQSHTSNSIPLAISVAILFNYPLFQILPYDIAVLNNSNNYLNKILYNVSLNKINDPSSDMYVHINNNDPLFVTSKTWDGNLASMEHISSIGNVLYTNYNIWLIITGFILLLAMVGVIVIVINPTSSNKINESSNKSSFL